MKHLKLFGTELAYLNYTSNMILPNVSYSLDLDIVHYNPYDRSAHDYIVIGGTAWATMNLGADSITDTGLYFLWGDTQGYLASEVGSGTGKKYFGWADYKYCNGTSSVMTKYNSTDGKTVLDASDDAATANWGNSWCMPTTTQFQALLNAVNTTWTSDYQGSGVAGLVCTDKTDSSKVLFFPAVRHATNGQISSSLEYGSYWSSLLYEDSASYHFEFSAPTHYFHDADSDRRVGMPIRPVINTNYHEYVDLGLPSGTKWARCNVGANFEYEYGNYYMFGKGTRQYTYGDSEYSGTTPLPLSVDTANLVWGGNWHIPTEALCLELVNYTNSSFYTINGVIGVKCVSTINSNYIFFPLNGVYSNNILYDSNHYFNIWCNNKKYLTNTTDISNPLELWYDIAENGDGLGVRPVLDN